MPRKISPPRLYLDHGRGVWVIRYKTTYKRTGFAEHEKAKAEAMLDSFLRSPWAFRKLSRRPGIAKAGKDVGELYFISAKDDDQYPIKIGFSCGDVYMRLKNIQVGNPAALAVICTTECHHTLEQTLHAALKPYRLLGEWFRRSGAVMEALEAAHADTLTEWLVDRPGIEPGPLPCKGSAFTMLTRDPEPLQSQD